MNKITCKFQLHNIRFNSLAELLDYVNSYTEVLNQVKQTK